MTDYVHTADGRVGHAIDSDVFSMSYLSIYLQRIRRATNCNENARVAVQYAGTYGWNKSNTKYLHVAP